MKKIIDFIIKVAIISLISVTTCYAEELNCNYTLRMGNKGERVKVLQKVLNEKVGCNLTVDGSFGKMTKSCVEQYQRENSLTPDGVVGRITCNSLNGVDVSENKVIRTYEEDDNTYAIVLNSKINVRKSPSSSSEILGQLSRGKIVKIKGTNADWYFVDVNGTTGYIKNNLISTNCIVVDISEQALYYFEVGNLKWSTAVVTGNEGNHDTPVGNYTLKRDNFKKGVYLKGRNDNGTTYRSYVDYWMPFIVSRGIGFHDASWRDSWEFTPTRFQGHGSHGCVNMQREAAEKLYNESLDIIDVVVRD